MFKNDSEHIVLEKDLAIEELIAQLDVSKVKMVFSQVPQSIEVWEIIEKKVLSKNKNIRVSLYGYFNETCDLSFLDVIPSTSDLYITTIQSIENTSKISSLKNLKSLTIDIYTLDSFDFLDTVSDTIEYLNLGRTKSKKPSLEHLKRFQNIHTLMIEGHTKKIDTIVHIPSLKKLVLRSVSPKDISFLEKLHYLEDLEILLGGIKDFTTLTKLPSLKRLSIWRVRGLDDISFLSQIKNLEYILLQTLNKVTSIPDLGRLQKLRSVHIDTLENLQNISGLFKAPRIEWLGHFGAENFKPQEYIELIKTSSIKTAIVGFGNVKKNIEFQEAMELLGLNSK